jgi:BFD-like [2Fe-2S] binding domain.
MAVDRCVCENLTFTQIRAEARRLGLDSVRALQAHGLCCTGCRLCAPYVKRMLQTGQTSFDPILPPDLEPLADAPPTRDAATAPRVRDTRPSSRDHETG